MNRRIRIGVDVGGTFTKSVAIEMESGKIIAKISVPTSHSSSEGVSTGIVMALTTLIKNENIREAEIELISHSTTQAVNALLEGDTAKVGIIGMGVGLEKMNVIKRTNLGNIELAPNKYLNTCYRFLDTSKFLDEKEVESTILDLKKEGAEVIIVSEAYGVDDPSNELFVMEKSDIPSTGGHELTGIYGLEIRTLTAAINAGILLKAIDTAKYVESAIHRQNILAPLMIMKGDGGITDMKTFKSRPILTVLSGPAASVAGALLHLRIVSGIFIEIGGTSTNICVIKNGKPEIKYVTIMKHPTCIKSLDVRVAGVAGGSLVRWSGRKITDVGPRSAHITGLKYSCYADPSELEGGQIITFMPKEGDPIDYIAIETSGGKRFAITNTCAANALDILNDNDYARGNNKSAKIALSILAERLGTSMNVAAENILEISSNKILEIINILIKDYKLKNEQISLIGGGGGASVIVPYIAKKLNMKYKIPDHSEVISSIGVASAMIREELEKTINEPKPDEITTLMDQVEKNAIAKGALPESITVQSEYVSEKALLRATAYGNMNLDIGILNATKIDNKEAQAIASELFGRDIDNVFDMKNYYLFSCKIYKKRLFLKSVKQPILVLDKFGRVRISIDNGEIYRDSPSKAKEKVKYLIEANHDSDNIAPQVYVLDGIRILDYSGLSSATHVLTAVSNDLDKINVNEVVLVLKI